MNENKSKQSRAWQVTSGDCWEQPAIEDNMAARLILQQSRAMRDAAVFQGAAVEERNTEPRWGVDEDAKASQALVKMEKDSACATKSASSRIEE